MLCDGDEAGERWVEEEKKEEEVEESKCSTNGEASTQGDQVTCDCVSPAYR